jgi:predicted CoA-binding protein
LRELVDQLNSIDERHHIIDTFRREEAIEAFVALAAHAGVPTAVAKDWIDEWREF